MTTRETGMFHGSLGKMEEPPIIYLMRLSGELFIVPVFAHVS